MTSNASRSALIHEAIQNGHEECLRCLLAYTRDNCLELGKTKWGTGTFSNIVILGSGRFPTINELEL